VVSLEVRIGKIRLKNPVMTASGTFGPEYGKFININSLGGYIAKTITLSARTGNPPPRVIETASGMLNSIGLENGGLDDFIKNKLPKLGSIRIPVIASIAGDSLREFASLASGLSRSKKIAGIEINLSCPNVKHGNLGLLTAQDEDATYDAVRAVREKTGLTIIAKLSPNVTDITKIALVAQNAGADAVSLVNTFVGMAVDIKTRRPILGNITGGLSGPAIKPIALRMVRDVYKKVKIPVIGIGGIMNYTDAVEFMLCGATAIQVGTANFINPTGPVGIISGLKKYMAKHGIRGMKELTGALRA
jgi:dihydroorotate dehydrogenase (NAD+) catalytic subunit